MNVDIHNPIDDLGDLTEVLRTDDRLYQIPTTLSFATATSHHPATRASSSLT